MQAILLLFLGFYNGLKMALSKTMEDLTLGSDTEKRDLCAACAVDGDCRPAVKFCLDCSQPICQTCVDSHRKIKQIKTHKIVEKTEDAVKVAETLSSCLACPNHANKTTKFLCVDHDEFCCSTCATVNHRGCNEVQEVATFANASPDIRNSVKHLADAKSYIERLLLFHQKSAKKIQLQASQTIPKQIQEMKACVMKTFDELEKLLLREPGKAADVKVSECKFEISKLQSHLQTVNHSTYLLSVAQEKGTDVHKYIAANNVEEKLIELDDAIRQSSSQMRRESLCFSFDKGALLQNDYFVFGNVHKALAEIEPETQRPRHPVYRTATGMVTHPFACLYASQAMHNLWQKYPY